MAKQQAQSNSKRFKPRLDLISHLYVNSGGPSIKTTQVMLSTSSNEIQIEKQTRSAWRQRLVDAETGFRIGLRTDSILFLYLFIGAIVFASGFVFGLAKTEWLILILTLGLTLSVELFHQLLTFIVNEFSHHLSKDMDQMMRLGTAAVVTANLSAVTVIVILFGSRLLELW